MVLIVRYVCKLRIEVREEVYDVDYGYYDGLGFEGWVRMRIENIRERERILLINEGIEKRIRS